MNSIRTVITNAIEEVFEERIGKDDITSRQLANRVIKRLTEDRACVAQWVAEMGMFKFVGFTSRVRPKTISSVSITRDHVRAFIANE
jgi:hypothetical protein